MAKDNQASDDNPFISLNKPSQFSSDNRFNGKNRKKETTTSTSGIVENPNMSEQQKQLNKSFLKNKRRVYS